MSFLDDLTGIPYEGRNFRSTPLNAFFYAHLMCEICCSYFCSVLEIGFCLMLPNIPFCKNLFYEKNAKKMSELYT